MTARVIQNVEQYNRDMFKLQDANKDTPPVGVRQFRNPFMQQSVNALLTAILAKGTGSGAGAVPVSSLSPGDLQTAESEEASGVFRRPDKSGKRIRRAVNEDKGERVSAASGNIADTTQEELSEAAKKAAADTPGKASALSKGRATLKRLQDDLVKDKGKLAAASAKRVAAITANIADLDKARSTLFKLNMNTKKAIQDIRDSKVLTADQKAEQQAVLEEQLADNQTRLKSIVRTEKPEQQKKLAAERANLLKKQTNAGVVSNAKQLAAAAKVRGAKASSDAAIKKASDALAKAKGQSKAVTDRQKLKDDKAKAKAAKVAADAAKAALKKADAEFIKSLAKDAAKAKETRGAEVGERKRSSSDSSDSSTSSRRSRKPSFFAKPSSSKKRESDKTAAEADKHADVKAKEKARKVFHKADEKAAVKHKATSDAATAKEVSKTNTTAARKAALQKAQLATLNSYLKIAALDAANPNVSGGNYMFKVNAQTASRDEIRKERKDWSSWYTARQKLFSAYEKDKAKQNALLAKKPTTRDGGVRGAGTRPGAVQTGGGN